MPARPPARSGIIRSVKSIRCLLPLGTLILAGFLHSTPTAARELFGDSALTALGNTPTDITIGDFNNDGAQDFAVASNTPSGPAMTTVGRITTFLGDGFGGFVRSDEDIVGGNPLSIESVDLDLDGILDLVVPDQGQDRLLILHGDGDGAFALECATAVASGPYKAYVKDLNQDGFPDVVTANGQANNISVLLGDGLGCLVPSSVIPAGNLPWSVDGADFDHDGFTDLAVANGFGGNIWTYKGDGAGGFTQTSSFPVSGGIQSLVLGEFDGDGHPDLAVAAYNPTQVVIYLGDGSGGFVASNSFTAGLNNLRRLELGDFNGDGNQDIAVLNGTSFSVSIFLGDGLGGFSVSDDLFLGNDPFCIATGDLNRDGVQDLAVCSRLDEYVGLMLGNGLGGFPRLGEFPVGAYPYSMDGGDFDLDGRLDIAVANRSGSTISILKGDGAGNFDLHLEIPSTSLPLAVRSEDVTGDSIPDLIVGNSDRNVVVYSGDGAGSFAELGSSSIGVVRSLHLADFDGDSVLDLAKSDPTGVVVSMGTGQGLFDTPTRVLSTLDGCHDLLITDIDGDSLLDIAALDHGGFVNILKGDGLGGFTAVSAVPVSAGPRSVAGGDFNGDGSIDLAVATDLAPRQLVIFLGNGSGGFSSAPAIPIDGTFGPVRVRAGDFNADHLSDLVITGYFEHRLRILLGDGTGGFNDTALLPTGKRPEDMLVDDLDGDGHDDVASINGLGETLTVRLNFLRDRADINGSNRVDGFDIAEIGRRFGCAPADGCYSRQADVNLDMIVDGQDLSLAAGRFGDLIWAASDLQGKLGPNSPSVQPGHIAFEVGRAEGDLFTLDLVATGVTAAGADLAVTYDAEVLQYQGYAPGLLLGGEGYQQIYRVDDRVAGRVGMSLDRIPSQNSSASGATVLASLIFKARSPGVSPIEFAPNPPAPAPVLLDAAGLPVANVTFSTGAAVEVNSSSSRPAAPELRVSASKLDFGSALVGNEARRQVRLSNIGISAVRIVDVQSGAPEFGTYFTEPFSIPGLGFAEISLTFSPSAHGPHQSELLIRTSDPAPAATEFRVALSGLGLACPPDPFNDTDFDGIANPCDNCPLIFNHDQRDDDGDAAGDACDVCPGLYDPAQADSDGDRAGDPCDVCPLDPLDDADADGLCADADNCPGLYNFDQVDLDFDGVGDGCDICPNDADPNQEDRNGDGSGDACQPELAILAITEDGGTDLEVDVRLADPQGDPLEGTVTVREVPTLLPDLGSTTNCGLPLPPEYLVDVGVAFGKLGLLGVAQLFDRDQIQGCQNGLPDYEIAQGACGQETSAYSTLLLLTGQAYPSPICIRRFDRSASFDQTLLSLDASGLTITAIGAEAAWSNTTLPAGMDISGLVPGRIYELIITATDNLTPGLVETATFTYQGESTILFTLQ